MARNVGWLLLLAFPAAAQEPPALTLPQALERADRAAEARSIGLEVDRARAELVGAGLWPNPEVSYDREKAGDLEQSLSVSQALPISGRLSLERQAARQGVQGAEARLRQDRLELHGRVRQAFIDILAEQERVLVTEAGLAQLDELVRVLRARESEGESSGFDRMRAERERGEVVADLHEARGRLARARAALAGPLGLDPAGLTAAGSLEAQLALPAPEEARAQAAQRGDIAALRAQVEQQELLARAAARRRIPEPTVVAGRKTSAAEGVQDQGPVVGISVAVPLFDRGQGARATAQAEASLLRARQAALESRVSAEAAAAVLEARARRDAETAYADSAEPDALVRIARGAYDEGEMRILELLDAYRTALGARVRLVELRAEARRAEVAVDLATGIERLR